MSSKDLDKLQSERVNGIMKAWSRHGAPILPEDIFLSERVVQTIASDKVLIPPYDKDRILATIPFTPATYVVICPLCINSSNFEDFQTLARSGLMIPVLLGSYCSYPEKVVELVLRV